MYRKNPLSYCAPYRASLWYWGILYSVFFVIFLYSVSSILYPRNAFAANPLDDLRGSAGISETDIPITKLSGGTEGDKSLETTLLAFLKWLYTIFWIVAVGFVVWAAFTFLTASGDEGKIEEAKKRLQYAVVATIIGALSLGIGVIVENILKGN